jgi:uncharacterized protein (DUF1501 family)
MLQTRREFISTGLKGFGLLAASAHVPAFLARTASAAGTDKDSPILVVIQLSGGNDGLNTVIPYTDDLYYKARPTIGLRDDALLKLNDQIALNAALKPLRAEFDEGRFAIVQNVGYPNPNRSHFRSMEILHTGSHETQPLGWLGRYFDAQCQGSDPHTNAEAEIGVSFGKVMPQAFRNRSNVALALDNPETFQWNASGETASLAKAQQAIFSRLNQPGMGAAAPMSMESLGGVHGNEPETLDFLKHTAMNAIVAGDQIRGIIGKRKPGKSYPATRLGHDLDLIAKLIGGGFPTRVYYANHGGFDTHNNQLVTQTRLLGEFAEAVSTFLADLRAQRNASQVTILAFSEFGRRVAENGSAGTDHGAAAPMFILGDPVKGGLHGTAPNLFDLADGDLRHKIDFRQVYAAVLDQWLHADSRKILGGAYERLPILG